MLNVIYHLQDGSVLSSMEDNDKRRVLAKETCSDTTGNKAYYVLCCGGVMYNPNNPGNYTRSMLWKLTRVSDSAYALYLSFLKSKKVTTLRQAERMI